LSRIDAPAPAKRTRTKRGGLYVTDAEIVELLGFCDKVGRRLIHEWEKHRDGRRRYPAKEFGDKRFWPAVLQWHMDYHGVRLPAQSNDAAIVPVQPQWEENFDAPAPREARGTERARSRMAPA
jgi:hypothetical protein